MSEAGAGCDEEFMKNAVKQSYANSKSSRGQRRIWIAGNKTKGALIKISVPTRKTTSSCREPLSG